MKNTAQYMREQIVRHSAIHLYKTTHLRRLERIISWKVDVQEEHSSMIW